VPAIPSESRGPRRPPASPARVRVRRPTVGLGARVRHRPGLSPARSRVGLGGCRPGAPSPRLLRTSSSHGHVTVTVYMISQSICFIELEVQFQVRGFKSSSFKARPGTSRTGPGSARRSLPLTRSATTELPRRQLAGRGQRPGAGLRVTSHLPGLRLGTAWDRDSGPDSDAAAAALTQADSDRDRRRRVRPRSALTPARDSASVAGPGSESRSP
jgi:hypothetical protein